MSMNRFTLGLIAVFIASTSLFFSCKKSDSNTTTNNNGGTAKVSMHLTDDASVYDAVWVNIQSVEVTMEGSSAVTLTPVRPGMYNILNFRNGLDTLLLRADLPAGKIGQIRLILGDGNYVVVNGTSYSLNTPSAQESGLKLNLNQTFVAGGAYDIWIDFDASKSIVATGNGKYNLKPVIRAYSATTDGRIKGYVLPAGANTVVYVSDGVNTYSAIPASDGYYMFVGLPAGTYTVTFDATNTTYQDLIKTNVVVSYGVTLDLGTIVLTP